MLTYIIKRFLIAIPILIGIVLLIFVMLQIIPGDPISVMMKEKANPAVIANLTERMGLNDPWYIRFGRYIWDALHGDFGISYKMNNREVTGMIMDAFPNTVKLTVAALIVAWSIGIPVGIISAVKRGSLLDSTLMTFSLMGVSMPAFWVALLFQYIFGYTLRLLPISGFSSFAHLIMPAFVLGWSSSGSIARMTRTNLLEAMSNDYIRTARAKGLRESGVIRLHALKNAMMPVVTMMAMQVAWMLSGAVMTETIFGIPGLGRITVDAIKNRDMPLLQGSTIFAATLIILGNLVADIAYSYLDPRIRVN
ncbi:MAG: ABC transporter permease [Clostridiales bacterium]|nr:ABC transporter permease [Clostridiales bacterium]